MPKKFKSEAFESIHGSASALLVVGAIDKATMREFDESCIATRQAIAELEAGKGKRFASVDELMDDLSAP